MPALPALQFTELVAEIQQLTDKVLVENWIAGTEHTSFLPQNRS
jgi:hypothetical protein